MFVCLTLEKILELLLNHCRKLLLGTCSVIFFDHTLRFSQIESLEPSCKVEQNVLQKNIAFLSRLHVRLLLRDVVCTWNYSLLYTKPVNITARKFYPFGSFHFQDYLLFLTDRGDGLNKLEDCFALHSITEQENPAHSRFDWFCFWKSWHWRMF